MAEEKDVNVDESGAGCGVCLIKPWTKEGCIGDGTYNWLSLCKPSMPWSKGGVEPPMFLGKDAKLPLVLSLSMGLQHALAMIAGIATSGGMLIAGDACFPWQKDSEMCAAREYLVSAAWITSGILTIIQVFRAKILGTPYYLGTGLISVMGTSFTFLPIARDMVISSIKEASGAGLCVAGDCAGYGKEGYGRFLGTCMVAALLEIGIALIPAKYLKKIFPPVVTGAAVMLIGGGLISAGIKYLGGGVFCAENNESKQAAIGFGPQLCNENGDVVLSYGSPEYIGLGFTVILMSTLIQFFGSPFFKSTFIFWGLMFGTFIAGVASRTAQEGDKTVCSAEPDAPCIGGFANAVPGKAYSYFNSAKLDAAPDITFLWTTSFPLGFAPEYLLPLIIGFFISSAETVGDISMSYEASELPTDPAVSDLDSRVQGGLLADGINSLLACLFTSPPNTTFSQNNGVIALTRCASRSAGFACAFWLILLGVLGKVGALFTSIPICVVGGMVLQCFSMVFVSGMQMACQKVTRRNSFILMLSLGLGLGVAMEPHLFEGGGGFSFYSNNLAHNYGFWPKKSTCEVFPSVTKTVDQSCEYAVWFDDGTVNGSTTTFTSGDVDSDTCVGIGGTYTPESSTKTPTESCANNNGFCCITYDSSKKMGRTTLVMILKTPYCIGFLIALFLNLLLPEDKVKEKEVAGQVATA